MGKSPLILAALAVDAVPRIGFTRIGQIQQVGGLLRMGILGNDGRDYEVLYPANGSGNTELAAEVSVLSLLRAANFSFEVPEVAGQGLDATQTPIAVVSRVIGDAPQAHKLSAGLFTESMAAALAEIHSLPISYFSDAGIPEFDTASLLHSRVAELDLMASTGRVPAALLGRWESAMEDVTLFRFQPTVIHGSMSDQSIRLAGGREGGRLVGLTDWAGLRIADPAEDFWWLVGGTLPETHSDLVENYRARRGAADDNILRRATLYSELQLGRWLLYCLDIGSEEEIARAEDGLTELVEDLEAGNLLDLTATHKLRVSASNERVVAETWLGEGEQGAQTAPSFIADSATEVLSRYEPPTDELVTEQPNRIAKPRRTRDSQELMGLEELF